MTSGNLANGVITLRGLNNLVRMVLRNELLKTLLVLLIFIVLLLTSCASSETRTQEILKGHAAGAPPSQVDQLNAQFADNPVTTRKPHASSDYKIGPEDLIEIDVFGVPELKTTARVSTKGFIKLSLVDRIEAAGLTVAELESQITTKLERFVNEPVVSVFIKEYRSQQISVLGSVKDPRVYYVTGQKYLLDMISMAGGLTPEAGTICVVRKPAEPGSGNSVYSQKVIVDLQELFLQGWDELNIPIYSGDIIHVPKSGIFFVDGAVRSPGEHQLKDKLTLSQAITKAGGMDIVSRSSGIKIYRDTGKPDR